VRSVDTTLGHLDKKIRPGMAEAKPSPSGGKFKFAAVPTAMSYSLSEQTNNTRFLTTIKSPLFFSLRKILRMARIYKD
jgi:hypothetical protein